MNRTSMGIALMTGLSLLYGCAGMGRDARQQPVEEIVERLDEHGVSAPVLEAASGAALQFVNADVRPHQIYSNDCSELSSTVLNPGDRFSVAIRIGPKACHFQALLAPLSTRYFGPPQARDEREEWRLPTQACPPARPKPHSAAPRAN